MKAAAKKKYNFIKCETETLINESEEMKTVLSGVSAL